MIRDDLKSSLADVISGLVDGHVHSSVFAVMSHIPNPGSRVFDSDLHTQVGLGWRELFLFPARR